MASDLFDQRYYQFGCGLPYARTQHWLNFFGGLADVIKQTIDPKTVLDAGCAMGFLVEALRDRQIAANGIDISEYAIGQARADIQPFLQVGSLTEPIAQRYDLVVCIEVLEHMQPGESERALANLCAASDDILISSSPLDYREPTHFNVQPPEYWAGLFAQQGFYRDMAYDAGFITPWAVRFRRATPSPNDLVQGYERQLWRLRHENSELRSQTATLHDLNSQLQAHENELTQLKATRWYRWMRMVGDWQQRLGGKS